jgi:hypothetical protein
MFQGIERDLGRSLTQNEKDFINIGINYLKYSTKANFNLLRQYETATLKFSKISDNILQITLAGQYQIAQITLDNQFGKICPKVIHDLTTQKVDALTVAPAVMSHFHNLPGKQKAIIFFGGGVRHTLPPKDLIKITHELFTALIGNLSGRFAVLTDGYKGTDMPSAYPATRAPHDISQQFDNIRIPRYMIVPECGQTVCHQSVHAKDCYGKNWGEEAPALAEVADAFVYIAPFHLITELEIILALKQNKPAVIIDVNQADEIVHHTTAKCGYHYPQGGIVSYKSPETAAKALSERLSHKSVHMKEDKENISPNISSISPPNSPIQYNLSTLAWDSHLGYAGFKNNLPGVLGHIDVVNDQKKILSK